MKEKTEKQQGKSMKTKAGSLRRLITLRYVQPDRAQKNYHNNPQISTIITPFLQTRKITHREVT